MKSILTHGGNSINSILESIILLQINFKIIESHQRIRISILKRREKRRYLSNFVIWSRIHKQSWDNNNKSSSSIPRFDRSAKSVVNGIRFFHRVRFEKYTSKMRHCATICSTVDPRNDVARRGQRKINCSSRRWLTRRQRHLARKPRTTVRIGLFHFVELDGQGIRNFVT